MNWLDTVTSNLAALVAPFPRIARRHADADAVQPASPSQEQVAQLVPEWGRLECRRIPRRG